MPDSPICPTCGTALPSDAPEGVCPACELRGALEEDGGEIEPLEGIDPELPRSFGDYVLLEALGRGGMGAVFKARQASLDRIVAVKLLPFGALSNPAHVKRFRAEAAAAAGLHHPNIVTVHEVGVHQGQHYLVMNFINGPPLSQFVNQRPLRGREAATYLKTVAEAIHHAHQHRILHRDLKPSNILLDENDQAMVTDFGLAKRMDGESTMTLTGQVLGSPNYMPPEQASSDRGRVTRRTDVYGLGATLYHLLTGRPPFQAATLNEAIRQVLNAEPAAPRLLNPGIPRDLETICLKCLEKEPGRRYATAEAVAHDLGRYLTGQPVHARPVGRFGKAWRWCRHRPVLAGLSVALVLTFAAGLAGVLWQWRQAVANELRARQNAYAADIKQAQVSLQAGDLGGALTLLNRYRPKGENRTGLQLRSSVDLRGWEWCYLWKLCQSDAISMLHQYPTWTGGLAVSSNLNLLAVRTGDGQIALWDLTPRWDPANSREITRLPASSTFWGVLAISADGNLLAAGNAPPGGAPDVSLWDLRDLQAPHRFLHESPVRSVAFSPDGTLLATRDSRAVVQVWDIQSGQVVAQFGSGADDPGGSSDVLRFSPDGTQLAFEDRLSWIRVVDWQGGTNTLVIPPHDPDKLPADPVTTLTFSPNGKLLAWAVGDGNIRLWDRVANRDAGLLTGHSDWILSLAFTPDGSRLVSASGDQTIRVWDVTNRSELRCLRGNEQEVWGVDFLPDGQTLVSSGKDGTVRLWPIEEPVSKAEHHSLTIPFAVFGPEEDRFATLDDDGAIREWDAQSFKPLEQLRALGTNILDCAISPSGDWLATIQAHEDVVEVWDRASRNLEKKLLAAPQPRSVRFSPGGGLLISTSVPQVWGLNAPPLAIRMWWTSTWAELPLQSIDAEAGRCIAVSPNDRLLAIGYENGQIAFWSIPEGRLVQTLEGHPTVVMSIQFSPDGKMLASAGWDDFAKVWDVQSGRALMTLRSHFTKTMAVAFSPDGRRLAVGGGGASAGAQALVASSNEKGAAIDLWDLATGRLLLTVNGATSRIAFSRAGNMMAGVREPYYNFKGATHFWRVPTWEEIEAVEQADTHR